MIRVTIDINGRVIHQAHAVRMKGDTNPDSINDYRTDWGEDFTHRYGDGAIQCAIEILKRLDTLPRSRTDRGLKAVLDVVKEMDRDDM